MARRSTQNKNGLRYPETLVQSDTCPLQRYASRSRLATGPSAISLTRKSVLRKCSGCRCWPMNLSKCLEHKMTGHPRMYRHFITEQGTQCGLQCGHTVFLMLSLLLQKRNKPDFCAFMPEVLLGCEASMQMSRRPTASVGERSVVHSKSLQSFPHLLYYELIRRLSCGSDQSTLR